MPFKRLTSIHITTLQPKKHARGDQPLEILCRCLDCRGTDLWVIACPQASKSFPQHLSKWRLPRDNCLSFRDHVRLFYLREGEISHASHRSRHWRDRDASSGTVLHSTARERGDSNSSRACHRPAVRGACRECLDQVILEDPEKHACLWKDAGWLVKVIYVIHVSRRAARLEDEWCIGACTVQRVIKVSLLPDWSHLEHCTVPISMATAPHPPVALAGP